ncbi:MAG TPA: contact-dependent growth inhibition system immunity protein [Acidothermaceae bacterium]
MTRRYFAVQEMFVLYFHEDWRLDADSRLEVATDFLATASPVLIDDVISELRELVREAMPDDEFHEMIDRDYSLSYDPSYENVTMRAWLTGLLGELEAGRGEAMQSPTPLQTRGRN